MFSVFCGIFYPMFIYLLLVEKRDILGSSEILDDIANQVHTHTLTQFFCFGFFFCESELVLL